MTCYKMLILIVALFTLTNCATPEGNARGQSFFKMLADVSERQSNQAQERIVAGQKPVTQTAVPTTDSAYERKEARKAFNKCRARGHTESYCDAQ